MKLKLTLLLFLLNCALFGYLFLSNRASKNRPGMDAESRLLVEPAVLSQVNRIEVTFAGSSSPWLFESDGSRWELRQPLHWLANAYAMEQLLFHLQTLSWDSRFSAESLERSGQSLADYNLAEPPIRLSLHAPHASRTLYIGNPTDVGGRLYLQTDDRRQIYVVDQQLLRGLSRNIEEFLDRRIFSIVPEQTRALQILDRTDSNVRVRIALQQNEWRFVSPMETTADGDRVRLLIEDWQYWEINRFVEPGADTLAAFEQAPLRLTFEGLRERENLLIIRAGPRDNGNGRFLGKREAYGAVFEIPAERVESLRRAQEELRERRVLLSWAGAWTSLQIRTARDSTTVQRLESGDWQVLRTQPEGDLLSMPADPARIAAIQRFFQGMEAVRFISDAPSDADLERFGLQDPQRTIVLRMADGSSVELRIGDLFPDSTLLYARTSRSPSVFLLRPVILGELPIQHLHYRNRTIRTLAPSQTIASFQLRERSSGRVLVDSRTDDPAPEDPLLAGVRETLSELLRATRVDRFLPGSFADPYPLDAQTSMDWAYELTASVNTPQSAAGDPPQQIRLLLGPRLGGTTQHLGDPQSGLVGILPPEWIEALDPLLVRFPEPFPSPPEHPAEPAAETTAQGQAAEPLPESATRPVAEPEL